MSQSIHLQHKLLSLGAIALLNSEYTAYPSDTRKIIFDYQEHFKVYNPRKPGYNRYGLSVTSQDGGFSGIPDLDSLREYNSLNGTNLDEPDFKKWTPFFKNCAPLKSALRPFHNYMGRSHILRLDKGGFFPPHRDLSSSSFRLFISLCKQAENYVFILDKNRVFFQAGRLYFINTCLSHSLFSFEDQSFFAVFNIDLCPEAVDAVFQNLMAI